MAYRDPRLGDRSAGVMTEIDAAATDEVDPALPCPVCGVDLMADPLFDTLRVCASCRRHFTLPARERLGMLVEPETFEETNAALISVDPIVFHDRWPFPDRQAEARERVELPEAVITGIAMVGGESVVVMALDCAYLGGSIGVVAGEKLVLAIELALTRRLPVVALCSGGGVRTREGMLALAQLAKTTAAATRLHRAGLPFLAVLTHPTTGGVYTGLANQADIILAEPGAQIGLHAGGQLGALDATPQTAESLLTHGMIDAIADRERLRETVGTLLRLARRRGTPRPPVLPLSTVTNEAGPAWEMLALSRHPDRPTSRTYIHRLIDDFIEIHGDRVSGDDPAVICGLGRLDGVAVMVVAQERGRGADRDRRREDRIRPAGYRKACRALRLAGHLDLPVITMIDTAGAASDAVAEAGGIGLAISQTLSLMSMLPVPIIAAVIGEAGSVGALALAVGDRVLMQERAVYSVAGVGDANPSFPDGARLGAPALPTLLTARECHRLCVVDTIVPEPVPAAHVDPDAATRLLRAALVHALAETLAGGTRRLLDERARRARHVGQASPEGHEAARHELRELQELQRTVARSLNELRDRWDTRSRGRPRLPRHLHRPDLSDLAARLSARRSGSGGLPVGDVVTSPDAAAAAVDTEAISS